MYLHCKHGFIEADRWDGSPIPDPTHQQVVTEARKRSQAVIILRSRSAKTLQALTASLYPKPKVLASPPDWDYPFRVYLRELDFKHMLAAVVDVLDYRNFKAHCALHARDQAQLAKDIWTAAYDGVRLSG